MYQCTGGFSGEGEAVHPPLDLYKIEKNVMKRCNKISKGRKKEKEIVI